MPDTDYTPYWKMAIVWLGTLIGGVTGQGVVLFLTAVFTALNIYVLLRDKVFQKPKPPQPGE